MFFMPRRRNKDHLDIWPGFVDAISTLLLVIIFVLMAFVLSQFYLTDALSNRDLALSLLNKQLAHLETSLLSEKNSKETTEQELNKLRDLLAALNQSVKAQESELTSAKEILIKESLEKTTLLQQLATLEEKIRLLNESLSLEITKATEKDTKLADILNQLEKLKIENLILDKENKTYKGEIGNYRSEFFAKLKEAIGQRTDIRVVGDRFVFQSEVLFEIASADLGMTGKKQLSLLVKALKEIITKIPSNINWILRVDGHTDNLPIHTKFASNWELSSARAISVVKYLIAEGIPSNRLVAAAFGEFQPLEENADSKAQARNRRIEFKLDQR